MDMHPPRTTVRLTPVRTAVCEGHVSALHYLQPGYVMLLSDKCEFKSRRSNAANVADRHQSHATSQLLSVRFKKFFVPCTRLSWPFHQFMSTCIPYRIVLTGLFVHG